MRFFKNLFSSSWRVRRALPPAAMRAIEAAISNAEKSHRGEICFAVEAGLDIAPLIRGTSVRERAIEVFSNLRVWDTEFNNGVLVYLLLAEHDVEIVADRGIHARVGAEGWQMICTQMESLFREGRFEAGVIAGIEATSAHLGRHYPRRETDANELPDAPVVL